MTLAALLSLLGASFLAALVPVISVELLLALAARQMGGGIGTAVTVALVAAVGMMVGKLQVFLVARGGRVLGGHWVRRRSERLAKKALESALQQTAGEPSVEQGAPAADSTAPRLWPRLRLLLTGPGMERLGTPIVLLSALVGIPPFTIVTGVAGVSRIRWQAFLAAGLLGRAVRFFIVYEIAALALAKK